MTVTVEIWAEIDRRLKGIDRAQQYERMPTGDPDRFPALSAYDDGERPIETETGVTRLDGAFRVEGFVSGYEGASVHDDMLELHADVVKALCDDETLGGLVELIEISGTRRVDIAVLAADRRLGFAQDFTIQFATARGDPHQSA